ncbi:aspartic peptidase domain-containing protein [Clohesyomyces aquaticus]|uniref:Aspartic peptidase domain-containing protein n=1 Tax=Clohesyomyces aquaticus TaxID=1231657 RepID=A0A1Y2A708_9PLEO|nr:aspartic peptidase domain-containing protein [Clohesyomyces aquaticus]
MVPAFRFIVSIGTPGQNFSVLPATNGQNIWVPIADDCEHLNTTDCGTSRGVPSFQNLRSPGFQSNLSSTWETIGLYEPGQDRNLGFTGNWLSGFDSVAFTSQMNKSLVSIDKQPVTAYATPNFWLGQIGLSIRRMNFREDEHPNSFLTSLKDAGVIPSLSFGYTAGAPYTSTKIPASLTLGGYDASRMKEPPLFVPISSDEERPLTVGLQSIVVTNSLNGTLMLSDPTGFLIPIDSSVSDLWLPRSICGKLESVFGLQYHEASTRYVLSESAPSRLLQLSPKVTVLIGTGVVEGKTISIDIPYSAFDLTAGFPIFGGNPVHYFPIRRAANDSDVCHPNAAAGFGHYPSCSQWHFEHYHNSSLAAWIKSQSPVDWGYSRDCCRALSVVLLLLGALVWGLWLRPKKRAKTTEEQRRGYNPSAPRKPLEFEIMGDEVVELPEQHGYSEAQNLETDGAVRVEVLGPVHELP